MKKILSMMLVASAALFNTANAAEDYPNKPSRVIVPFAPGGGPILWVENKPGAAAILGSEQAIRSKPDGYTLLLLSGSYTVNPNLYKLNFDPIEDIAPVIQLAQGGYVLVVHPSVKANTFEELIQLLKDKPGELAYSSSGTGGHLHVITEYMLDKAKAGELHVPYRGTGPAVVGLLAGDVQMMFGETEAITGYIQAGKLKALRFQPPSPFPLCL